MARAFLLVVCAACGAAEPAGGTAAERDDPSAAAGLQEFETDLELTWRGHPVGAVHDRLTRRAGGDLRFERRETWKVTRAGRVVEGRLELRIDTDAHLVARRVEVTGGAGGGRALAVRGEGGWRIEVAGEPARRWRADAVPAELVPLWMVQRGKGRFDGPVLMSGMAFAPAEMSARAVGERVLEIVVTAAAGSMRSRVVVRADRTVERVVGGEIEAWRVARPREVVDPVDVIEGVDDPVAVAVAVNVSDHVDVMDELPDLVVPDPPVSAAVRAAAERAVRGGGGGDEIVRLARATAELVEDDLAGGPVGSADDVLSRARGDCVAHAVLFSAMARARGIRVRLVTGFRLDGQTLVRHAWALVERGGALVAVDPTAGVLADRDRYLALAVHGSAAAEMALAAELAYAAISGPPSGRSTPRTP